MSTRVRINGILDFVNLKLNFLSGLAVKFLALDD